MSETKPSSPTCMDPNCSCYKDQSGLTREFMESADPHVRLIAHMSNRQLSMVESLNNVQLTQQGLIQAVNGLAAEIRNGFRALHERIDTLQLENGIIEEIEEVEASVGKELATVVGTIPPRK
jgi:hypothetical protein